LSEISASLKESGYNELSEKIANIAVDMLKEAGAKDMWDWSKKNLGPLGRGLEKAENWWTGKGTKGDVIKRIQGILDQARTILDQINFGKPKEASLFFDELYKQGGEFRPGGNLPMTSGPDLRQGPSNEGTAPQPINQGTAITPETAKKPSTVTYPGLKNTYMSFLKELHNLSRDLSGYAAKGDKEVAPLIQSLLPIVNNYLQTDAISNKEPGGEDVKRSAFKNNLSKFVTNLTNTMGGIAGDMSFGGETKAPVTPVAPGTAQPAASATSGWGQGDPVDQFLNPINDVPTLTKVRDKAHSKIQQLSAIPKASAVVSSKLKLGISKKK
jgi:hypothetical protein